MYLCASKFDLMKKVFFVLGGLACLCGCGSSQQVDNKKVIVSILPLKYIVECIVGNDFQVEVLVQPGASPETYEPTPAQMMSVTDAKLVFTTGLIDFERQLAAKLKEQSADHKFVDLSKGIELIEGECTHGGHHHGHGVDPHIWSSPRNLKTMAQTAYESIALLYPDSINKYRINYEVFIGKMDSLDKQVADILCGCKPGYFIIYHPALTYFARDYGIRQVALEHEGKEPVADKLKTIIGDARKDGLVRIFYQKEFSPATVETVAREMGATCVEIDPLREDVDGNILYMARLIAE